MASGVFHTELQIELDLGREDLGHPSLPELWQSLHRKRRTHVLQCLECRKHRPDCPEWMYLRERMGRREAVHFNPSITHHEPESDEHKALKERIVRAAEDGGFRAEVEQRASHGKRRTDVLVTGNGVLLGCEAQLSLITVDTVKRRSKIAQADGITPLWMTNSQKAAFIDAAPWARIDRLPWHVYLEDNELPIRGGYRRLSIERCERLGTVCPDKKAGRPCRGWHGEWVPNQLERFDDLIIRAAGRELVPVRQIISRVKAYWFWTTIEDLAKVEPAEAAEDGQPEGTVLIQCPLVKQSCW